MNKDSLEKLSYLLSQGGSLIISKGSIEVGLADTSLKTTAPQLIYSDFLGGLSSIHGTVDCLLNSYRESIEVEDRTKKVLEKADLSLETCGEESYKNFHRVIRYLIKYKVNLTDDE